MLWVLSSFARILRRIFFIIQVGRVQESLRFGCYVRSGWRIVWKSDHRTSKIVIVFSCCGSDWIFDRGICYVQEKGVERLWRRKIPHVTDPDWFFRYRILFIKIRAFCMAMYVV